MPAPIVVAGAGIAGLATAVALHRLGLDVSVIEERTDTSSGAGISIWPNALAALDQLGLGDAVRDAGGRVSTGSIRWHTGRWLRRGKDDWLVAALGEPMVVVRRPRLTEVLAAALPAGCVRNGVAVRDLTRIGGGVRLALSDGSTREAAAVIGADGTRSVVARHLNGPLPDRFAGYTSWRGVAPYGIDPGVSAETFGPGAEFGQVPLGAESTYWFATEHAREGELAAAGELAYLRERFGSWAEPIPQLLAATDPAAVARYDIYDRGPARHWSRGPILAVGDAAHPMRPHLGQGGAQALEDAAILGAFLAGSEDVAAAFARFEAFRRPRVAGLVRRSALVGRVLNLPSPLSGAAIHATALVPQPVFSRQLAATAARAAFVLPAH